MAHHVVQHPAPLQLPAPEPGHVRSAVLFGGAREVGAAGPRRTASVISSTFSMRAKLGPHSQMAPMAGSATMAAIDAKGLAGPTSSRLARSAMSAACARFGLHTPRT